MEEKVEPDRQHGNKTDLDLMTISAWSNIIQSFAE